MKNLAIIPARGGSKRIPHKNIKSFLGKPIIAYSIETAIQSELFDEIIVSTDDTEIVAVALEYGASVPFLRSSETANDHATLADVLREILKKYSSIGRSFDNMCCILATAPLLTSDLLIDGYQKLLADDTLSTVYPIVPFSYPVQRCLQLGTDGSVSMLHPEYAATRSQDLETLYHDSGTFYWHKIDPWLNNRVKKGAIVMDELHVQDVDTEMDWKLAELKYQLLHAK
jgi:N-acylneuraminate cytidylyltransferase